MTILGDAVLSKYVSPTIITGEPRVRGITATGRRAAPSTGGRRGHRLVSPRAVFFTTPVRAEGHYMYNVLVILAPPIRIDGFFNFF